jgi:hypothetical protein
MLEPTQADLKFNICKLISKIYLVFIKLLMQENTKKG